MTMGPYFAMRVETKYKDGGLQAAQTYYNQVFGITTYKQFQSDTDAILIAEGYGDVIPSVTQ